MGHWWEAFQPLGHLFRLALRGDDEAECFHGVHLVLHVGQDSREPHVVLWIWIERCGGANAYPTMEPDARACLYEGRIEAR